MGESKMIRIYSLIDREQYPEEIPHFVFESSLTKNQIQSIERQAEKEFQKEKDPDFKSEIMIRLIKKVDKKFKAHTLRVVEF